MLKRGAQVLEEALSLPPGERAELIDKLLSSLDSPSRQRIDELWAQEAEDRLDAFERGEIETVSSQEVFDEIDKIIKKKI
ncbi:MAG: addiction module protein [bacterium]